VVEYNLNSIGSITSVTVNETVIASALDYEPFGDLASMDFNQNGITTTITHNYRYGIDRIQSGTTIVDRKYTHDFNGNITYIKPNDSLPSMPDLVTRTDNYTYVTDKDWIDGITEGSTVYQYTYDANGNITSDGRHTYVYNEQNQLYRVLDGQTVLGEYTYNVKGQRVKKVASSTTIYHYDLMGNLIQETNQSGGVIVSYVYAGMNRLAKVESSGAIYYYHNDHLGTPLAMTDSTGTIVWKAAYNPFGKAEVDPSSTVTNNFRFPGQYYDSESGLYYNWYRYYDPGTGRYVTADPIWLSEEANLYTYARNNPNTFIDPQGLKGCGPGSGFKEWIIPDFPFGLNFLKCCNKHDDCYGCEGKALGKNRRDCDLEFCKCLIKVYLSEWGFLRNVGPLTPIAYCLGVIGLGEGPFNSARQCCP
jgi:RHS repeat-associated protein